MHGICSNIKVTISDAIFQQKAIQLSNWSNSIVQLEQFNCSIDDKNNYPKWKYKKFFTLDKENEAGHYKNYITSVMGWLKKEHVYLLMLLPLPTKRNQSLGSNCYHPFLNKRKFK